MTASSVTDLAPWRRAPIGRGGLQLQRFLPADRLNVLAAAAGTVTALPVGVMAAPWERRVAG